MDEIDWDAWWFDNQYELNKALKETIATLAAGDKDKAMSLWAAVVETAAEEIRNLIPTTQPDAAVLSGAEHAVTGSPPPNS